MSGIQEILVLIVIILGIFFLPRIINRGSKSVASPSRTLPQIGALSGRFRLAVVLSILWPAAAALYFEPWHRNISTFIVCGIGPVVLLWGAFWVLSGFKKTRK